MLVAAVPAVRGQDVRVNEFTQSYQSVHGVATSGSRFRVVWHSDAQPPCTPQSTTWTRELDLQGRFTSPATLANETCASIGQKGAVGVSPSGLHLVAWPGWDGQGVNVYARLFDAAGAPLTGEIVISQQDQGGAPQDPSVAYHPSGRFVVVWAQDSLPKVFGRVVMPDGSMPGPELELVEPTAERLLYACVSVLGSGALLVTWEQLELIAPYFSMVRGRLFDQDLGAQGASFDLTESRYLSSGPRIALAAAASEFVVAWNVGRNDPEVWARRFREPSIPLGSQFQVNTYTADLQARPSCGMDGTGAAVITWDSYQQDGASTGVYGQRLDPQGQPWGPEFRVNMTTYNPQGDNDVAMLPSGDFLAVFTSMTGSSLDSDVLVRRFFFPVSMAIAPGPSPANAPSVVPSRPDGRSAASILPYNTGGFGATVGAGDVRGGSPWEVLTGPGPSPTFGPQVRAFAPDGTAVAKVNFYAYGTLRYGVKEGGADLDGDPFHEILTTPGPGAPFGPHARGWNFDGATLQSISKVSFYAFSTLRYGANGSGGEMDADGYDEILVAPGPGAAFGATIRGFDYDNAAVIPAAINYNPFTSMHGATVSAADVESDGVGGYGDGFDEIVSGRGPGPGNAAEIRLDDYDGAAVTFKKSAVGYSTMYGVNVAGGDVDAGDTEEVATAPGPDPAAAARILCWEWNPKLGAAGTTDKFEVIGTDDFTAFSGMTFGASVADGTLE